MLLNITKFNQKPLIQKPLRSYVPFITIDVNDGYGFHESNAHEAVGTSEVIEERHPELK